MTILKDFYECPRREKKRARRTQQGWVNDLTLLEGEAPVYRPDSRAAREALERPGEVLFIGDWIDMVFLHLEVDPEALQEVVPLKLDCWKGRAFVSLVAFTMRGMRPALGGNWTKWLVKPIGTHQFVNLRTYVVNRGEAGIYFMKEWVNNRLAATLGPLTYSLPYHYSKIVHDHEGLCPTGSVKTEDAELRYGGGHLLEYTTAEPGTEEEFLFERYTAFASARGLRRFRVWHRPWKISELIDPVLEETSLLDRLGQGWTKTLRLVSGHHTHGVKGVQMGRPERA